MAKPIEISAETRTKYRQNIAIAERMIERAKVLRKNVGLVIMFNKKPLGALQADKIVNQVVPAVGMGLGRLEKLINLLADLDIGNINPPLNMQLKDLVKFRKEFNDGLKDNLARIIAFYLIVRSINTSVFSIYYLGFDIGESLGKGEETVGVYKACHRVLLPGSVTDPVNALGSFDQWLADKSETLIEAQQFNLCIAMLRNSRD